MCMQMIWAAQRAIIASDGTIQTLTRNRMRFTMALYFSFENDRYIMLSVC